MPFVFGLQIFLFCKRIISEYNVGAGRLFLAIFAENLEYFSVQVLLKIVLNSVDIVNFHRAEGHLLCRLNAMQVIFYVRFQEQPSGA